MWGRRRRKDALVSDRAGLRMLCELLVVVRQAGIQHDAAEFAALAAAARNGGVISDRVRRLAERLGVPVDVDLRGDPPVRITGIGEGRPTFEAFGCPSGGCDRHWLKQPARIPPECAIDGVRLTPRGQP